MVVVVVASWQRWLRKKKTNKKLLNLTPDLFISLFYSSRKSVSLRAILMNKSVPRGAQSKSNSSGEFELFPFFFIGPLLLSFLSILHLFVLPNIVKLRSLAS